MIEKIYLKILISYYTFIENQIESVYWPILKLNAFINFLWSHKLVLFLCAAFLGLGFGTGYYYYWVYIPRLVEEAANEANMIAANAANALLAHLAHVNGVRFPAAHLGVLQFAEPRPMGFLDTLFFLFNKVVALADYAPRNRLANFIAERHPGNIRFDVLNRPYYILDNNVLADFDNQVANNNLPRNIDLYDLANELNREQYGAVQGNREFVLQALNENNEMFYKNIEEIKNIGYYLLTSGGIIGAVSVLGVVSILKYLA